MSITSIKIQQDGEFIGDLLTSGGLSFGIQADSDADNTIALEAGSNGMTLGATTSGFFESAYVDITGGSTYVTSINGVTPTEDGSLFIIGSVCDSVYMPNTSTVEIYDLCPVCPLCDKVLAMERGVEYYKTHLNAIKDVNLYTSTYISAHTRDDFTANRIVQPDGLCDISPYVPVSAIGGTVAISTLPDSIQLLKQYVTTVHMWNYLVSRNDTFTELSTAPEDNSGLVIQTKYSLPACDPSGTTAESAKVTLQCVISVECVKYPKSDNLRVVHTTETQTSGTLSITGDVNKVFNKATEDNSSATWTTGKVTGGTATTELGYTSGSPSYYDIGDYMYASGGDMTQNGSILGEIISYNPLSIFATVPELKIKPFNTDTPQPAKAVTTFVRKSGTSAGSAYETISGSVVATYDVPLVSAATYHATVKLLPFIWTRVFNNTSGGATELNFDDYVSYWQQQTASTTISMTESGTTSAYEGSEYYLGAIPVAQVIGGTQTMSGAPDSSFVISGGSLVVNTHENVTTNVISGGTVYYGDDIVLVNGVVSCTGAVASDNDVITCESGAGLIASGGCATLEQYEKAKLYPSKSPTKQSNGSASVIQWKVGVEWKVVTPEVCMSGNTTTVGGSSLFKETYYFETAGLREYIDGLLMDTDLVNI